MFLLMLPALLLAIILIPFSCSNPIFLDAEAESPPRTHTPENYNFPPPTCVAPCGCDENGNPKPSLPGGLCPDTNRCPLVNCSGDVVPEQYRSYDTTKNCKIDQDDAQLVINYLNTPGSERNVAAGAPADLDVNGDGRVNSLDALLIINLLNSSPQYSCATPSPSPSLSPSPSPSPSLSPSPSIQPSRTPSPSPSPSITPSSSPSPSGECLYYSLKTGLNTSSSLMEDLNRHWDMNRNETFDLFSGAGAGLACLDRIVEEAIARCVANSTQHAISQGNCTMTKNSQGIWQNKKGNFVDDPIGGNLLNVFFNDFLAPIWSQLISLETQCARFTMFASGHTIMPSGLPRWREQCTEIYMNSGLANTPAYQLKGRVIDKNCNVLDIDVDPSQICGDLVVDMMVSPISLEWDVRGLDSDKSATIVNSFGINPNNPNHYYVWRASGSFPLLGIDLNNDGKINDGSELFGEWTFGGKNHSSLSTLSSITPAPWRDGFEALSSLDTNSDGWLTGEELSDIMLFFDYNQNGICDDGEMHSARSMGITKLSTKFDRKDPLNNDLISEYGYERQNHGTIITGRSIDWYAKAYESRYSALQRMAIDFSLSSAKTTNFDSKNTKDTDKIETESILEQILESANSGFTKVLTNDRDPSGIWKWEADGDSKAGGLMIFASTNGFSSINKSSTADGAIIAGATVIEAPLVSTKMELKDIRSSLLMNPFVGLVDYKNNTAEIQFEISNKTHNSVSRARLEKDGTLSGQSEQQLKSGEIIKYTWKAKRIL